MSEALPFVKMHGLGNDFVVVDARTRDVDLPPGLIRAIADRHTGVGFDQFVVVHPARSADAEAVVRFLNADGSEAGACGNATRCVAAALAREAGRTRVTIETVAGLLPCEVLADGQVAVDMGPARFEDWREIPLAREVDTLHLPLVHGPLADPVATSMGNPHATFFVRNAEAIPLDELGPALGHDPLFPERANIGVASVTAPDVLRLRVWERGVGLTRACGSGACAAVVAAARRGLTGRRVRIDLDGGRLELDWRDDGHVVMTGPVAVTFRGELTPEFVAAAGNGPAAGAAA